MYIGIRVKYRYAFYILMKFEFPRHILKNPQISNFIKTRPVGAELLHADGQTDRRTGGQADGRTETDGQRQRRTDGQADEQTDRDRRTDRRTDGRTDGQTDMTKLIVVVLNFS